MHPLTSGLSFEEEATIEARIWEYIDGTSQEETLVEQLIADNIVWKAKYEVILEINGLLGYSELEHPSLRFTKNVMDTIALHQIVPITKKYINTKIIWAIGAFFIASIVAICSYSISIINWSAPGSSKPMMNIPTPLVDFTLLSTDSLMSGLIMFNMLLGLFLLDRFLNARRKKMLR